MSSKANLLASALVSRRHYFGPSSTGSSLVYEPHFLIYEFTHGMLLREAQVSLLRKFLDAQAAGRSLCHQLIMGQGKTTVIAPMLAIMLADGERFVVSVVPPHLLPSAQGVLRERLGGPVARPVYGMRFDRCRRLRARCSSGDRRLVTRLAASRYTTVEGSLLERLRHATRLRGVLLLDPTSLKSVLLKFIEGVASLQGEAARHALVRAVDGASSRSKL